MRGAFKLCSTPESDSAEVVPGVSNTECHPKVIISYESSLIDCVADQSTYLPRHDNVQVQHMPWSCEPDGCSRHLLITLLTSDSRPRMPSSSRPDQPNNLLFTPISILVTKYNHGLSFAAQAVAPGVQ
jgi:hypothetical protein